MKKIMKNIDFKELPYFMNVVYTAKNENEIKILVFAKFHRIAMITLPTSYTNEFFNDNLGQVRKDILESIKNIYGLDYTNSSV